MIGNVVANSWFFLHLKNKKATFLFYFVITHISRMTDGRKVLKEWREAMKEKQRASSVFSARVDEDSKKDCQKFAALAIQTGLQKKATYADFDEFVVLLDAKLSGSCQWKHFKPIIKEQCMATFGERCTPISRVNGINVFTPETEWGFYI